MFPGWIARAHPELPRGSPSGMKVDLYWTLATPSFQITSEVTRPSVHSSYTALAGRLSISTTLRPLSAARVTTPRRCVIE